MKSEKLTLYAVVAFLIIVGVLPLILMFVKSIVVENRLSISNYTDLFRSTRQWQLAAHSLLLSAGVALLSTVIGVPLGILFGKTDLRLKKMFAVLFSIPLLLPSFVMAVAWFYVLGRKGILGSLAGINVSEFTSNWLFGLPGCLFVLTIVFMPVVMMLTIAFLKTIPPDLEEVARLNSGWKTILREITLPLIAPGIIVAILLVFLLTLGELTVPMFLRYDVFPVQSLIQFSAFYNFGAATAVAAPLALLTFVLIFAEKKYLQNRIYFRQNIGSQLGLVIKLNRPHLMMGAVLILLFIFVVLPLAALVVASGNLRFYTEAIYKAFDSLIRSIVYSISAATILVILGFLVGYFITRRSYSILDSYMLFLFATPGPVIGIALISLWNRPATTFIYNTPLIIILGYLAQYLVLTSRISSVALNQVSPSLEEAAQISGAGWLSRTTSITVPLIAWTLAASWVVSYIFCFRDTAITMTVYPAGNDTLTVRMLTLMANSPQQLIAALCVIMVLAILIPLLVAAFLFRRRIQL